MKYDFGGWATKNDLKCSDGRIIRRGAFKINDGTKVPLVWNHRHEDPSMVLGHAQLENRDEGVYAYCKFNSGPKAKAAKESLKHGDIVSLSIWANNLVQEGRDVVHGAIREVSLVLAGANPGAFVESVISHGESMDEYEDEGILFTGDTLTLKHSGIKYVSHAAAENEEDEEEDEDSGGEKTIAEIYDSMTKEQKDAVAVMVGMALDEDEEDEEEDDDMRHNLFEGSRETGGNFLSHADEAAIISDAKSMGSLSKAIDYHLESGVLSHALDTEGMEVGTGKQTYGFNDASMLFPDHKTDGGAPTWITRNMDWVNVVMNGVSRSPFSRIKSLYANITEDEARAKGYIKGKEKKEQVFTTLKRTTDPQTIYKKQKLDRDDVLDITDFDVVTWIRAEMRVMLNEEIARAILIGDGRPSDSEDKIQENHVHPIATDVPLFNIKYNVSVPADATDESIAKAITKGAIKARKKYKGSGNPVLFTTEDYLTELLLLEDQVGHRLYKTEVELATALRVSAIYTVEAMENQTVDDKPLIGIIVNLKDYKAGADKGGEITNFEDFDIDFNQYKYLIETRMSGALVKPFSAITLLLDKPSGRSFAANRSTED